jgi:hypothetical protein
MNGFQDGLTGGKRLDHSFLLAFDLLRGPLLERT